MFGDLEAEFKVREGGGLEGGSEGEVIRGPTTCTECLYTVESCLAVDKDRLSVVVAASRCNCSLTSAPDAVCGRIRYRLTV